MFGNCTLNLKIAGEFFNRHAVNSSYLKIRYSHGLKDCRFMFYFTFLPEFYCTFPSRYLLHYRFRKQYLVLRGGPRKFKRGSTCPFLLGVKHKNIYIFDYRTFTFFGTAFQPFHLIQSISLSVAPQPSKI